MELIEPQWPAPARVRALVTTRAGGASHAPYDAFNLGIRGCDFLCHLLPYLKEILCQRMQVIRQRFHRLGDFRRQVECFLNIILRFGPALPVREFLPGGHSFSRVGGMPYGQITICRQNRGSRIVGCQFPLQSGDIRRQCPFASPQRSLFCQSDFGCFAFDRR